MPQPNQELSLSRAAAAVSAALRIPLTDLFAHINLLATGPQPLDERTGVQLQAILTDAYHLLRAAGAITLTASCSGEAPPLVPLALWEELSQCVHSAATLLSHSGHRLEYEFPTGEEQVKGDITSLSTALLHLICNALQASPAGSTVTVKGSILHDKAVISVSDHGCGIPPERIGEVFTPFYSSSPQGLPYQSLGLGLSLAKAVFQQHGGSVQLLSEQDGTTVVCTLPLLESPAPLSLSNNRPLYLEDRYSPAYVVLCDFIPPPWPC